VALISSPSTKKKKKKKKIQFGTFRLENRQPKRKKGLGSLLEDELSLHQSTEEETDPVLVLGSGSWAHVSSCRLQSQGLSALLISTSTNSYW
jgi:hypothetical protein